MALKNAAHMNPALTADKRPISVAHIDHTHHLGGAEIALARLVNAGATWRSTLVVPHSARTGEDTLMGASFDEVLEVGPPQAPGAATAGLGGLLRAAGGIVMQAILLSFNRQLRAVDVIHTNSTRAAVYGAVAARILRRPLVVHIRDMIEPNAIGKFGYVAMRRVVLPRADAIIANSASSLGVARQYTSEETIQIYVPSPTGMSRIERLPPPRQDIRSVGMIARLDQWKGQHVLLRAFAREFGGTKTRLVLVGGTALGDTGYRDSLVGLSTTLGIGAQVELTGQVPPERVVDFIDRFDICVHCSIRPEPLGQNVLHYLLRGKPAIVSKEGGPAEWVKDGVNGLTVTPDDVEDLAEALRRARDVGLRTKLSQGARATKIPTDAEIAQIHGDLYERVAKSRYLL